MKIVVASNNEHKIKEFKSILSDVELLTLKDIGFTEDIEETGESFLENALIKAKTVSEFLKKNNLDYDVLSDDSGLCCVGLNLEPGVYSHRFGGNLSFHEKRMKLIKELEGKNKEAYFMCTIVLYHIDGTYEYKIGKTYGTIIDHELGDTSFGYDAIFLSRDLGKTFGEALEFEKNQVSHRGRALEQIKELIRRENA